MTSHWSAEAVAAIGTVTGAAAPYPVMPVIDRAALSPILAGHDVWDHWPVQHADGRVAMIGGGVLMMLLCAPATGHPDARHAVARIRLMHRGAGGWRDLGNLFPDGFTPGSREWAGSAVISEALDLLTVYFTAAGHRGEAVLSFDQRLFETQATIDIAGDAIRIGAWRLPAQSFAADGDVYVRDMAGGGAIGTIKAFRDPSYFRDPADGAEYLLFTGSLACSLSGFNGAIGLASRAGGGWQLEAPLIEADGLNNELERPHVRHYRGLYYCFWSTQRSVFAFDGPNGPNGLYGMVAEHLRGPWRPLNATGLVLANPPEAPIQAYSWLVLDDLSVLSFADMLGVATPPVDADEARRHFGGVPAPLVRLLMEGDRVTIGQVL